jgi:two-component system, OmpR family, phosphate regulon response regulator PhoB
MNRIIREPPATAFNKMAGHLPQPIQAAAAKEESIKNQNHSTKISLGDFEIDRLAYTFRYQGKRIDLALNEYFLLIHFLQNPNRVFLRRQLITVLGKNLETLDERTVDVWMGRLRRSFRKAKIPDHLRTVRSVGYVFDEWPV